MPSLLAKVWLVGVDFSGQLAKSWFGCPAQIVQ
jgi:hypothetical protein